jgi:hypothetical protein
VTDTSDAEEECELLEFCWTTLLDEEDERSANPVAEAELDTLFEVLLVKAAELVEDS